VAPGGDGTTISHLVIDNFYSSAIDVQANNVSITGSYLGTSSDGESQSGNVGDGVQVEGTGVHIGGPNGTTPGGSCTGDCNLISGNYYYGAYLQASATGAVIQGNFIGTDVSGNSAFPNGFGGITSQASGTLIGGVSPAMRNVISGNRSTNIEVEAPAAIIEGNFVGVHSSGQVAFPGDNTGSATLIVLNGADNSIVGGSEPDEGNVVTGAFTDAIRVVHSSHTSFIGNLVGTGSDGVSSLGNGSAGLVLVESSDVTVGGTASGEGNVIAYSNYGVVVSGSGSTAIHDAIRGNSIHDNSYSGVALNQNANNLLAAPQIGAATHSSANGTACANCAVDLYSDDAGQGRIFEGSVNADNGGAWAFAGSLTGPKVTAIATDASHDSSTFSTPVTLTDSTPTPTPSATATSSPTPTATATVSATRTQGDFNCDGSVNDVDYDFLLLYVAGLNSGVTPGSCPNLGDPEATSGFPWGDVNCDGHVDLIDVLYIVAFKAGISLPPVAGNCFPIGQAMT
jgi:hypothetical protein